VEEVTGVPRDRLREAALMYGKASRGMLLWGMGITQHLTGVDGALAIANLSLLTGHVGRPGTGFIPLRGQSNVQGCSDMQGQHNNLPGYHDIKDPADRAKFEKAWGVPMPEDDYLTIIEMEEGASINDLEHADATFGHEVPAEGHFYLGTQCFQCANPPCVEVCPVSATWQEPDGITVIDYDWCIGCRYCEAACPYWARRFNWSEPEVPAEAITPNQHYLGNRARTKGVVEKCTYCIQRSREGRLPACAEACPTGARVFGNLLDPGSDIRWVLENKQVFRLKEELGTEPRFWYYMD
jgi:Fe-S-cluster-containing dehydrogenase component